ncbi:MAG: hypothetical protein AABX04_02155 [Nanoarchaeota archaeon]
MNTNTPGNVLVSDDPLFLKLDAHLLEADALFEFHRERNLYFAIPIRYIPNR